jgi:glycerophosphoryl diester phosphodiesterase
MKKTVIASLLSAIVLLIALAAYFYASQKNAESKIFKVYRIAHAGGEVKGVTYTNSYDALNLNLKKRFRYFEIDFSFTQDEQLVCLHDWQDNFKQSFGFSVKSKLTLAEYKRLVQEKSKFVKCTLDGLAVWMKENPSAYLVTDVKEDNYKALKIIAETIEDSASRVIPQIYNPHEFKKVKELGYKQIIWTLYRYAGNKESVLKWVDTFTPPFAITMPQHRGMTALPENLRKKGIPSYVHTINAKKEKDTLLNTFHVSEIYTDFLAE